MNEILSPEKVADIFGKCLFQEEEDKTVYVKAEGIVVNVGFHPKRLEEYRPIIEAMLNELPEQFHEETGGGWSFLQACQDKDGELWTGFHQIMEQLFLLGMAINKVRCLLPRDMWYIFPGGMPYYVITKEVFKNDLYVG